MSSDQDDLRLNTLHRFAKHSTRLVLEEHSHCEVPAGCGGVVLRWADPDEGTSAAIYVACLGKMKLYLDGHAVDGVWVDVAPGNRLLALHIRDIDVEDLGPPPLLTRVVERVTGSSARIDAATGRPTTPLAVAIVAAQRSGDDSPGSLILGSSADDSWLAAPFAPKPWAAEAWRAPDFDDSTWMPLADDSRSISELPEGERWRFRHVADFGAQPLRMVGKEAWIRCRFHHVPAPADRGDDR